MKFRNILLIVCLLLITFLFISCSNSIRASIAGESSGMGYVDFTWSSNSEFEDFYFSFMDREFRINLMKDGKIYYVPKDNTLIQNEKTFEVIFVSDPSKEDKFYVMVKEIRDCTKPTWIIEYDGVEKIGYVEYAGESYPLVIKFISDEGRSNHTLFFGGVTINDINFTVDIKESNINFE
jgi:hypothetical protein